MKKIIPCLVAFLLVCSAHAQDKAVQFQMNGRWLPSVDALHVGANNYVYQKNLRPTGTGMETVDGYTKINTVATAPAVNLYHFSKESESHVVAKVNDSGTYYLYQNETAIPSQGNFTAGYLKEVAEGLGSFTGGPQGTMFYADSQYNLIWGGDELRTSAFLLSSESDATLTKDFTQKINSDVQSEYVQIGGGFTLLDNDNGTTNYVGNVTNDASYYYTANGYDGIQAWSFDGSDFVLLGSIDDVGYIYWVWSDGTYIYAAAGTDGIVAYSFNGTTFTQEDILDNGGGYEKVWGDGTYIYAGINGYGIRAYTFSGSSLALAGELAESIFSPRVLWGDGTYIFMTHGYYIYAYTFNGTSFTKVCTFNANTTNGNSYIYGLMGDGTYIYTSEGPGYLYAYTFNGSSFSQVGNRSSFAGIKHFYASATDIYCAGDSYIRDVQFNGADFSSIAFRYTDWNGFIGSDGTYIFTLTPSGINAYVFSASDNRYFYIGTPLKIDGIKAYISNGNQEASTIAVSEWTGEAWSSKAVTDNTSSGGAALAQTGTITWTYEDSAAIKILYGNALYWYRFYLDAGSASIYKITVSAPLQPIRDVWNGSPRTCTSFQASRSSSYEDYTFRVESRDSAEDANYAATIGGLTSTDHIILMFDDRAMGFQTTMISGLVNAADAQISDIQYFNGTTYVSVGYFEDGTLDAGLDSSFAQSGTVSWNPPTEDQEYKREIFGITGYSYRITIDGTLTTGTDHDGTSIDFITGIAAPLDLTGYNAVGKYNGRVMLINGGDVDFSQTDQPWVFNGVDSSDNGRLRLNFGGEGDIVATTNLFNRYGSNLIEAWVVLKKNSTYILTGVQPYVSYAEPFIIKTISTNIGCAAPATLQSYEMEVSEGLRMGVAVWLDFSGPIVFNGAVPTRLEGIENYFDPSKSECINYNYIEKSVSYIDSIHDQWNLIFPSGSSATANNKWVVFDFKYKKWFEKVPPSGGYPVAATSVTDTNGARYNYGFLSSGYMMRLDNGATWDSTAIAQQVRTGIFSPPINDEFGFWSYSQIRGIRLISDKITEDQDVTISFLKDGTTSSQTLTIPLNVSGAVSRNLKAGHNLSGKGEVFQVDFSASTAVEKWRPLAWGYKARFREED
jgi:hypothetical protein